MNNSDTRAVSSFMLGIVVGLVIMLLIGWSMYYSRTYIFSYCPRSIRGCSVSDYVNDPSEALMLGFNKKNIFKLKNGEFNFVRPSRGNNCVRERPEIVIKYPMYCSVKLQGHNQYKVYKSSGIGSSLYNNVDNGKQIELGENCNPERGSGFPMLEWDSY